MDSWKQSLVHYFEEGIKPQETFLLGVEVEHFILDGQTKQAVPYAGPQGVRQVLTQLQKFYPDAICLAEEDYFGFKTAQFTITLEPAAQLEISIVPMRAIRQIGEIYRNFRQNLDSVLAARGYIAQETGCQPVSKVEDLTLIPKKRYQLMDDYFRHLGMGGMEMMRGTASTQISIDYQSETDFRRKIQAAYYYGPVLKLLCDHAPSFQGRALQTHLKRTDIWRRVDPARCGIVPGIFTPSYGFEAYAEFLGNMPPIFVKNGDHFISTGRQTVEQLFVGKPLSKEDMVHLISMVFPDVRLKQFVEIRFADSMPLPFLLAYSALIKGLLYYPKGLDFAQVQISKEGLSEDNILHAEDSLMTHGWEGMIYGQPVRAFAQTVLALARCNLSADEQSYLQQFEEVVNYGGMDKIPAVLCNTLGEQSV